MVEKIFSQYEKNGILHTIMDDGECLLDDTIESVSFIINEDGETKVCELGAVEYGIDVANYEIRIVDSKRVVTHISNKNDLTRVFDKVETEGQNNPFIVICSSYSNSVFIPKYMEEIMETLDNGELISCLYIADKMSFLPCTLNHENNTFQIYVDNQLIFTAQSSFFPYDQSSKEENKKIHSNENMEEDDEQNQDLIEVESVAIYESIDMDVISKSYRSSIKTQDVGKEIRQGVEFQKENKHLKSVVSELTYKITSIESKNHYVGKYATVHGGDDGTESMQLKSYKEESEKDRKIVYETRERREKPYTYRVDIKEKGVIKQYYIGPVEINDLSLGNRVISFHDDYGHKLITHNPKDIEFNKRLQLRREFSINHSMLNSYRDIYTIDMKSSLGVTEFREKLTDPYLINVLKTRRNDHGLTDIILTIQKEQNNIVDAPMNENMIVQGCAGSGKTMVMMHRLSRLQNWVHAFDPKEVLILAPSTQYEFYMKAVSEGLAIQNIQQNTLEEYYIEALREYDTAFSIKRHIISDFRANKEFVRYIYSDLFLKLFFESYEKAISDRKKLFDHLLREAKKLGVRVPLRYPTKQMEVPGVLSNTISKIKDELTNREDAYNKTKDRLNILKERNNDLKERLIPLSKEAFSEKLRNAWEKTSTIVKEQYSDNVDLVGLIEENENLNSDNEIQLLIYKIQRVIPNLDEYIREFENAEKLLNSYVKERREKFKVIENVKIELEKEKKNSFSDEYKNEIENLGLRVNRTTHYATFIDVFNETIKRRLQVLNIRKPSGTHRYDLYAMLHFCRVYFGTEVGVHTFICVDEAQDIAVNEYKLLKAMHRGNVTFNIYGDINQVIHPERGITDWNSLNTLLKQKTYELKENYRNTNPITAFCNEEYNMDIKQVGIDGKQVSAISFEQLKDILNETNTINNERWGILIPATIRKKDFFEKLGINNNLLSDVKLGQNYISLMFVYEVKGFEFEKIFCFSEGMNQNEEYIAATRALNELVFVDMPSKKKQKPKQIKEEKTFDDLNSAVFFKKAGLEVIDKRKSGGALWVVGEKNDIEEIINEARQIFRFDGWYSAGKATGFRNGWYTKSKK